jgi:hypothetical protein
MLPPVEHHVAAEHLFGSDVAGIDQLVKLAGAATEFAEFGGARLAPRLTGRSDDAHADVPGR